jgi:hypothetical protein
MPSPEPRNLRNDEPPHLLARRLRRAQQHLAARPRQQICAALTETAALWNDNSPWFARAEPAIAAAAGFSPAMVRHALPAMIAPLGGAALQALAAEADMKLDSNRPRFTLQILPSNVPGLAAIATALSLICRSATLLKPGRRDCVFTRLWVESLAAIDADLAACVAVAYWPGGDRDREDAALAEADLVIASGGDDAIAVLRPRVRRRFAAYGSRLSIAAIAAECRQSAQALGAAARGVALDVAVWDQRGCLSPRLCFVEGDLASARAAAAAIAEALRDIGERLPRGSMSSEEILAVRRFRDAAEWADPTGGRMSDFFFADDLGVGSVVVDAGVPPQPAPTHRCLRVIPVASIESMLRVLEPLRGTLEGVGLAAAGHFSELAAQLRAFGIPLVAAAGELQRPPLDWRHGGRSRIAPWTEES